MSYLIEFADIVEEQDQIFESQDVKVVIDKIYGIQNFSFGKPN